MKLKKIHFTTLLFLYCLFFGSLKENIFAQSDIEKVRNLIASAADKNKPLNEIIELMDVAIKLSDEINYPQGKADALNIKGRTYLKIGEYPEALSSFWEELSLREKNPEWKNSSVAETYNMIGESYRAIGSFELALQYLNKGIEICLKQNNSKDLAYAYNRYGAIYFEMASRNYDTTLSYKADEYALKSLEINNSDTNLIINSYNILGASNTFRKNFKKGLNYLFLALRYAEKDSTYHDRPNILNNISSSYYLMKNYDSSLIYAKISNQIAKNYGIQIYIHASLVNMSSAYAGLGDYENAYKYYYEANGLYTKLFDDKKTAEIYALQKKHELALKEYEEKAKSVRIIIISIAFFLLGLVVTGGIYIKNRQQISQNKELSKQNEIISKQKEELSRLNAAKDKFFSILSHDIRNPLNGILGFSNILYSDFDKINNEEKKEYIGYLKDSSESLYKLIERLLFWSRLRMGKIEIKKEKINLKEIIQNVLDLQKTNAIKKGIILENHISLDIFVFSDKYLLDTVLRNLVDNAIKFTEQGGKITIDGKIFENNIEINVTDNGIGINSDDINKIFTIEQKVATKGTQNEEGTGLGLVLCKDMLELLGANLKVESEVGKGSRFYFELPLSNN